jgi:uncharacterized protein
MIRIEARVAPSAIHGLGLFAVKAVPRGAPVWQFEPGFDREFSPAAFAALPPAARRHLEWFAFLDAATGHWILSGDHACFMNHSPAPNTGAPSGAEPPVVTVAVRPIAVGEEITCNYFAFDAAARAKLNFAPGLTPP